LSERVPHRRPDMPGRGDSAWRPTPTDSSVPTDPAALTTLLAHADVERVAWVGTSMGGLLGMVMAAQRDTPVTRLVINDVGPVIEPAALTRISGYVGLDPVFDSFAALEAHIREVSAPFGALSDAQWTELARSTARQTADGKWRLKYDPGIAVPFRSATPATTDLWAVWDAVRCPTLLLRGAESDLLSPDTAAAMRGRGPKPRFVEFPGVGHAPMLLTPEQIAPVAAFLEGG
jgi:pimeloyl-ACP methyl ester carboxylesterase